jgi:proteasome lid subunit RPN8/RPN11
MKAVALATACLLASCASLPPAEAQATWFQIDGAMLAFLDSIHPGLPTEVMLCLNGEVHNGVVKVTRFRATRVTFADWGSLGYEACAPEEFVGIVHSHPKDGGCYLSQTDLNTSKRNDHEIDLIICGGGMFAWRTKGANGIISRHEP